MSLTIQEQLSAAIAARKSTLKDLRGRIMSLLGDVPVGVKLSDDQGLLFTVQRVCTGASQWSNQTWNVTITGRGLIDAAGRLVAEDLDDSKWDGSNMHYRSTEPICLGTDCYDGNYTYSGLSWVTGKVTRELAARLPAAIDRYMNTCKAEAEANSATLCP